ncbi:DNA cytosine methyltransferase [Halomonas sp. HMF6819]|uniref:DNA cytosine methyltransferase n=1 Tax=Halomonas sp. HMF6819 TaxID=3373085 RepID=UPI00379A6A5E
MLTAISLFSGIGGLDFGFEAAGFQTKVALELDGTACQTMRLNRPEWNVIEDDVNHISSAYLLERAGLSTGEPDVLIGGPPCQPFSKSSYWVSGDSLRLDDPRADTLTGYLRVLRDTLPKAFLLENVSGLAFKNKDEGLRLLIEGIEKINRETGTNYRVTWKSLKCANYGVPQTRERVFMVGAREGQSFNFPSETHCSANDLSEDLFSDKLPHNTAWDAIGGLAEPSPNEKGLSVGGKWGGLLPSIPEGKNYLWHTNRGGGYPLFGWRTRYWSFMLKLAKALPSWTIQAQPGASIGPFHWNNRRLTFEEMARLQTFPSDIRVECGRTEMQRMVGNAVPSLMAEILAREIRTQILRKPLDGSLQLMPKKKISTPEPEPTAPLASQYKALIGEHDDHPGTGRGKKAITRARASTTLTI